MFRMQSKPKLIFLLNSAQRRLQQWMATHAEAASADGSAMPSPAQSGVLFALSKTDGMTMGQLADALDLAPSAVSGLIQRMESLGWVRRHPDPDDARAQRVWLQESGRQPLPALTLALKRVNQRLSEGFTNDELLTVARWLRHVQQLDDTPVQREGS